MSGEAVSISVLASIFVGAFCDAVIPICFFVFGEVFFLLAGGLVFSTGSLAPIFAAFSGAYLADNFSFFVGQRLRRPLRRIVWRTHGRRRAYRRVTRALMRRPAGFIAISRLLGPVAWMTPALAGSLDVPWRKLALGAAIGVVVGVGQFVALGWFAAYGAEMGGLDIDVLLRRHMWAIILGVNAVFGVGVLAWRHFRR